MPVGRVNTELLAKSNQIPADAFSFFHRHHGAGAVDVAVDGELGIGDGESGTQTEKIPSLSIGVNSTCSRPWDPW